MSFPATSGSRAAAPRSLGPHLFDLPHVLRQGRKAVGLREGHRGRGPLVESSHGYAAKPLALAVRSDGRIAPAIPGMVMDLDATTAGGPSVSRRLYASIDPHSTGEKVRDCASCHLSSWALGLGTGTLTLSGGKPAFTPATPAAEDPRMAADAWTRFGAETPGPGTRVGLRSLDTSELADHRRRSLSPVSQAGARSGLEESRSVESPSREGRDEVRVPGTEIARSARPGTPSTECRGPLMLAFPDDDPSFPAFLPPRPDRSDRPLRPRVPGDFAPGRGLHELPGDARRFGGRLHDGHLLRRLARALRRAVPAPRGDLARGDHRRSCFDRGTPGRSARSPRRR